MAIEAKKIRYKIKCTRCDAMLIYDKEDVKEAKGYDEDGTCWANYWITCPICNTTVLTRTMYGIEYDDKQYKEYYEI